MSDLRLMNQVDDCCDGVVEGCNICTGSTGGPADTRLEITGTGIGFDNANHGLGAATWDETIPNTNFLTGVGAFYMGSHRTNPCLSSVSHASKSSVVGSTTYKIDIFTTLEIGNASPSFYPGYDYVLFLIMDVDSYYAVAGDGVARHTVAFSSIYFAYPTNTPIDCKAIDLSETIPTSANFTPFYGTGSTWAEHYVDLDGATLVVQREP